MNTTNQKPTSFNHFIGIDVGKFELVIYDSKTQKTHNVDNNHRAVASFLKSLKVSSATLAACEASGGYEAVVLACLVDKDIAAHRANAVQIKSFIASYGRLAKTDAGDARAIALYAQERHKTLLLWGARDETADQLQALVLRREDLVAMCAAEKNRAKAPNLTRQVERSCNKVIDMLNREINKMETAIAGLLATSETLTRKHKILTAMHGIGTVSASAILAHMPEIGTCTRRKAASLAGLAPHPRDSGSIRGYRSTRGGRPNLKRALFMPAMVNARGHSDLAEHYNKLVANGKKPIVAITAIMRKIITIANARIRDDIILQQS